MIIKWTGVYTQETQIVSNGCSQSTEGKNPEKKCNLGRSASEPAEATGISKA
jgi:hypothetical protein